MTLADFLTKEQKQQLQQQGRQQDARPKQGNQAPAPRQLPVDVPELLKPEPRGRGWRRAQGFLK